MSSRPAGAAKGAIAVVICVYGASSQNLHPDYFTGVEQLGRAMGRRGHALLFGGGQRGLMGAAARGVKAENGRVIGVAPRFFDVDGILYPHCDEFLYTDTMRQRKQLLEERADAFVAVPGGLGTFDELFEILTLKQLGLHGKPVALLNLRGYFDPLLALLEHGMAEGFLRADCRTLWADFRQPEALLDWLEGYQPDTRLYKDLRDEPEVPS